MILIAAGLFEIAWAVSLKQSDGFTRLWPSFSFAACLLASTGLLALAMRSIPLSTAYPVWTGIGAIGSVVVAALLMGEALSPARLLCIAMIAAGAIGLRMLH
jgi:quaternary ammonium compound-resistance protein SugE